jgi:hypothetical protein
MNPTLSTLLKAAAVSGVIALSLGASPAAAQVVVRFGPPGGYISTARPYYHEGRANYRYGNNWYYREGRSWRRYDVEPRQLREYRNRPDWDARRHYERGPGFRYR